MGERQKATVLMPTDPASRVVLETEGFSEAVIIADDIYLSGVVTELEDGEAELEVAYTRSFESIGAILARGGASWDDVVEITSFHTDFASQLSPFVAVKSRFVRPPHAAWTAIGVSRLVPDKGITEIKVIAKRPAGGV
jgi:enamine deaminase RidA (YjgF/YER057c/UK114 family)